jgi:hypothetical protein
MFAAVVHNAVWCQQIGRPVHIGQNSYIISTRDGKFRDSKVILTMYTEASAVCLAGVQTRVAVAVAVAVAEEAVLITGSPRFFRILSHESFDSHTHSAALSRIKDVSFRHLHRYWLILTGQFSITIREHS